MRLLTYFLVRMGLVMIAFIFLACVSTRDCELHGPGGDVVVDEADNNTSLTLITGQALIVRLPFHSGTGYSWEVVRDDTRILRRGIGRYENETNLKSDPKMGAVETQVFVFQAVRTGETAVKIHYRRLWETGVPALETFQVAVVVK